MDKLKAALIATGFMPEGMDPFEAVEKLAAMGYKGYEMVMMATGGMPGQTPIYTVDQAVNKIREVGMEPLTTVFFPTVGKKTDVAALIEENHKYNISRATSMGSTVAQYRFGNLENPVSYDDAMWEIEELERVAAALKKEGIVTCFHNHDAEFTTCYKGVPYYYLMAANSDDLKFELDCGWATYAGFDPVKVMKQLGDRLCAIHIKDFADGGVDREGAVRNVIFPRFTTPGTGYLKMKDCLQTALDLGIDYAIIEQDYMYNLDPLATAQAGYYNMKETGLVE